jgi:hypothetical protein
MTAEKREEFDFQLAEPLPGEVRAAPDEDDVAADGAAFMALYQQRKG